MYRHLDRHTDINSFVIIVADCPNHRETDIKKDGGLQFIQSKFVNKQITGQMREFLEEELTDGQTDRQTVRKAERRTDINFEPNSVILEKSRILSRSFMRPK